LLKNTTDCHPELSEGSAVCQKSPKTAGSVVAFVRWNANEKYFSTSSQR